MKKTKAIKFYEMIFENHFIFVVYILLTVFSFLFFVMIQNFLVQILFSSLFGFSYYFLFRHHITNRFFTNILEKLGLKIIKVQYLEIVSYGIFSFYIFLMTYFLYKYNNNPFVITVIALFAILTAMTIVFFFNEAKKCMFTYPKSLESELSDSEKITEFNTFLNIQKDIKSTDILKKIEEDLNKEPKLKKELKNISKEYFIDTPLFALTIYLYYVMEYEKLKNQIYYTLCYSFVIPIMLLMSFKNSNSALIVSIIFIISLFIHPYIREKLFFKSIKKNLPEFFKSNIANLLTKISLKNSANSKNKRISIRSELYKLYKYLGIVGLSKENQFLFFLTIVIIISLFLILLNAALCVQLSTILNKQTLHNIPNFLNAISDGMASFIGFTLPEAHNYILKFIYTLVLIEGKIYFLILLGFILTKASKLTD